ncbi:MAG: hypothetical protein LUE29_14260 [Lachnospiraceae bacterium]|nr:hypothetical protein [Lachnospiraceae bacterium]
MKKYKASEHKVDLYDIGDGLTLMNVILKNQNGEMMAIDTYIGREGEEFSCVGHTKALDQPGVIFSYARYVRMMEANLSWYRDAFFTNIGEAPYKL